MDQIHRHSNRTKMSFDRRLHFFRPSTFVLLCLTVVFSAIGECSAKNLELLPNDPSGLVGEDMRLTCTLTNSALELDNTFFTIVYYSQKKHHPIPAEDVRNLSDTSVEVTLRNVTDRHHYATVFCRNEDFMSSQIIEVGHLPSIPKIYYYRYLDWKEFVFRWKIKPATNGFPTKYRAWFKSSEQSDFTSCNGVGCIEDDKSRCHPYQDDDDRSCHISEQFLKPSLSDGYIHFKVNATNKAGSTTSENITILLYDYIEPGPVRDPKVSSKLNEKGGLVDVVSFQPPRQMRWFTFQILTKTTDNLENTSKRISRSVSTAGSKADNVSIVVRGLKPYTVYSLAIRSTVEVIGRKKCIWSRWTNITFTSHEEAPLFPPAVCQSCFQVDEDSTQRIVLVYFKPLSKDESRGNVSYDLTYVSSHGNTVTFSRLNSTDVDNELPYFHFNRTKRTVDINSPGEARMNAVHWKKSDVPVFRLNLLKVAQYQLNVSAKTMAGDSPPTPTTVLIPPQSLLLELQPPKNCSVMSVDDNNENLIVFRWNNTPAKVTVFWCKAFLNNMRCQQTLNWKEVDRGVTSVNITLTDSYEGYLFGIGQDLNDGYSSGIHWACPYYKKTAVASPPLLYSLELDENRIVMKVDKPNYNPKEGLVYGFNLYYSPAENKGGQQETKVYVDNRGLATIDNLKRGTSYNFKAESLTMAGPSYTNASVRIVTLPFRLTEHELGWIIFLGVVIGIFALVGISCCIRWPHEQWIKLKKWIKFEPCMPSVVLDEREEKEKDSSYPTYSVVFEKEDLNVALIQNLEEDRFIYSEGRDRPSPEDVVQPYSWIARRREESGTLERRPSKEMNLISHLINVSNPEHVLPLLEQQLPDVPIRPQPLPDLMAMAEQSIKDTPVGLDFEQDSQSDCYIVHRTFDDDIGSFHGEVYSERMLDQVLPTDNSDLDNHENDIQSPNSQSANETLHSQILPSPNDLVSQDSIHQMSPAGSQQVRNNILPELSQNTDESMSDRMMPVGLSSQRMLNADVIDARPPVTDRVLLSANGSAFNQLEPDGPSVVILSDQFLISDNEQSYSFSPKDMLDDDDDDVVPSYQRVLPNILQTGSDLKPPCGDESIGSAKNLIQTEQEQTADEDGVSVTASSSDDAAVGSSSYTTETDEHQDERTQRIRQNSSSSLFSTADQASSEGDDDSRNRQITHSSSIEGDEGVYVY